MFMDRPTVFENNLSWMVSHHPVKFKINWHKHLSYSPEQPNTLTFHHVAITLTYTNTHTPLSDSRLTRRLVDSAVPVADSVTKPDDQSDYCSSSSQRCLHRGQN